MQYLKPLAAIIDQFTPEECPLIMIKGQNAGQMLERLDYLLSNDYEHLETQEIIMFSKPPNCDPRPNFQFSILYTG